MIRGGYQPPFSKVISANLSSKISLLTHVEIHKRKFASRLWPQKQKRGTPHEENICQRHPHVVAAIRSWAGSGQRTVNLVNKDVVWFYAKPNGAETSSGGAVRLRTIAAPTDISLIGENLLELPDAEWKFLRKEINTDIANSLMLKHTRKSKLDIGKSAQRSKNRFFKPARTPFAQLTGLQRKFFVQYWGRFELPAVEV